ncbi:hypothetical protein BGW42_006859 [Actinomortierella wolfii]|nr:hypothetical protein BGW42_006859 [Actinomortierella wolfii]
MCQREDVRMAMLKDLNFHAFEFSDATGQFTLGVVLTMLQGKMNADGKLLYGMVVRNKDVEVCPVGSLASYLFVLFMAVNIVSPRVTHAGRRAGASIEEIAEIVTGCTNVPPTTI